jgi:aryl-alcohol dehydrogenase-like predicted oxidoreductase
VGLGCNNFGGRIDRDATRLVVDKALELGVTLFDTADIYGNSGGSEELLGEILGARRKQIVLATKFGMAMDSSGQREGASRRYIMEEVEASLKRLRTDWIDLYQQHQPDPLTPIEETLGALDELVRQGKVRHIGNSNFTGAQIAEAQAVSQRLGLAAFVSCQNEYSLLVRGIERDVIPAMQKHGLGLLPYYPLASGLLTGKYRHGAPMPEGARLSDGSRYSGRYLSEENWRIVEQLRAFCESRGRSLLELAFGWLASRPGLASVIAGATRPEQVEANVRAVGWKLAPEEIAEVDRLTAASLRS